MNPILARRVLQLDAALPLTSDLVETAYQRELWARHPSRYPDTEGRAAAEEWARTLGEARATLLVETFPPPAPGSALPAEPRRRLSGGAITGIVVAGVAVIALVVAAGLGLGTGLQTLTKAAAEQSEQTASDAVERLQAGETWFTFSAALEMYSDGRLSAECPGRYLEGCWETAVFTEADCTSLEVTLGFSEDSQAWTPEETDTLRLHDVVADERTPVVFGNDDWPVGWIEDLVCLDSSA